MLKIPKEIQTKIIEECGVSNIVIAVSSGIAGGAFIFTIVLANLMRNNN